MSHQDNIRFWRSLSVILFLGVASLPVPASASTISPHGDDISGAVVDSVTGKPLPGGEVRVLQEAQVIAVTTTDEFGHFIVHNLPGGTYVVSARYLGYRPVDREYTLDPAAPTVELTIRLAAAPVSLEAIAVTASVPLAVDTRTGDQIFKQNDYHGAPTNTTSQILQQSIAGAARAPTGEVHIRGQHAEYTYYVDGIPVPSGISGSLNELFDPNVVNQIDFQTGSWDAEYGNKNAAIVNVTTRIPSGPLHVDVSSYLGSFGASGEALSVSRNVGKFGFFLSGTGQVSDMRQEPVVFDTLSRAGLNSHNHGADLFGFGKVQWVPTDRDVVNLDVSRSRTSFQVPFDSTGGVSIDDHQQDLNGFVNLGWRHRSAGEDVEEANEVFIGAFYRDGSLRYLPGATDQPSFILYPDTTTPYNLQEDRNFHTVGVKVDYTVRPHHGLEFKTGALVQSTSGHEDFTTSDSAGNPGPAANSGLTGSDVGGYVQTAIAPSDRWEVRAGVRYDRHRAPFAGDQHQLSPRIKLSFFPDPASTFWVYYGRLFVPTNVEDLRAITSDAQGGVAAEPTLPERDHFLEVGFVHRYPFGVVTKLSVYHKQSEPGIDDNTVPGSAITTSVNIQHVRITGIEGVVEVRPSGPVSGYLNLALNHAYGYGTITGGFFPTVPPSGAFDLDHDQRISAVGNVLYARSGAYLSLTGIYGSGLTNGDEPDSTYGTGLFAMNQSIKVAPSFILNAGAGYAIAIGSSLLRPQIYVDNVFNHHYLLKGAFFSGASVGRPRTVEFRLNLGM
jgi:hypothetical protein